jgi:CheY-like chemotaxis protein
MGHLLQSIVEGDLEARAVVASDGETALDLARTLKPDLILLDLFLPKVDGLAVCRDLKASPITHSIPIVSLTGSFQESIREQALQAGVDSFVHKIYGFHELLPLLVEHLGDPGLPEGENEKRKTKNEKVPGDVSVPQIQQPSTA